MKDYTVWAIESRSEDGVVQNYIVHLAEPRFSALISYKKDDKGAERTTLQKDLIEWIDSVDNDTKEDFIDLAEHFLINKEHTSIGLK